MSGKGIVKERCNYSLMHVCLAFCFAVTCYMHKGICYIYIYQYYVRYIHVNYFYVYVSVHIPDVYVQIHNKNNKKN